MTMATSRVMRSSKKRKVKEKQRDDNEGKGEDEIVEDRTEYNTKQHMSREEKR